MKLGGPASTPNITQQNSLTTTHKNIYTQHVLARLHYDKANVPIRFLLQICLSGQKASTLLLFDVNALHPSIKLSLTRRIKLALVNFPHLDHIPCTLRRTIPNLYTFDLNTTTLAHQHQPRIQLPGTGRNHG